MKPFTFSGISHAAFATGNMDMTVEYWRDLLGFKLILGLHNEMGRQYAFQISPQMMVFFFEWENVEAVKPKRHGEPVEGPFVFDHLAIQVCGFEDLEVLQNQFISAGFAVSDIIDHGFLNSIYTFDPNGIPLEFTCPVSSVDLDKTPLFIDDEPAETLKTGLLPVDDKWPDPEMDDEDDIKVIIEGREKRYFEQ